MYYTFVCTGKILWDSQELETVVCAAHRLQNAVKSAVDKRSMQKLLCLGGRSHEAYSSSSFCHSFIHSFIHSVRRQNSASAEN